MHFQRMIGYLCLLALLLCACSRPTPTPAPTTTSTSPVIIATPGPSVTLSGPTPTSALTTPSTLPTASATAPSAPLPTSTATPAAIGELVSERVEVWYAPWNAAARQIEPPKTTAVGVGDETWTQRKGRALLKFPDLWLRLYDNTRLRVTDVTPTGLKAALGYGAALLGDVPGVQASVVITAGELPAARAVITVSNLVPPAPLLVGGVRPTPSSAPPTSVPLTGTLTMVAYLPAQQVTLVHVAYGFATITPQIGGKSGASRLVRASEWAIIGADGKFDRVMVTQDGCEIETWADRLGIRELLYEIEADAQTLLAERTGRSVAAPQLFSPDRAVCCQPPQVNLTALLTDGLAVSLHGRAAPGCIGGYISQIVVNWGDGVSQNTDGVPTFAARHAYPRAGVYVITVTAHDTQAQIGQAQVTVTLMAAPTPSPTPTYEEHEFVTSTPTPPTPTLTPTRTPYAM